MNMQIAHHANTATVPVLAPSFDASEPVISLIKAYKDGLQTAKSMRGPISDEPYSSVEEVEEAEAQDEAIAAITWQPPMDELLESPPPIQTMKGAIAALNFAFEEYGICEGSMADALVPAVITYLEAQEAGASLIHPDADLLTIGAKWEPINSAIRAISDELTRTDEESRRLRADRAGLRFTQRDWALFGLGIADEGHATVDPYRVRCVKPYDLAIVAPEELPRCTLYNKRLAELQTAAEKYKQRITEFYEASGRAALFERQEALYNEREPLQDQIQKIEAKTLAGFAVKAKVIRDQFAQWWRVPKEDLDYEQEFTRDVVDNLLSLHGEGQ